VKAIDRVKEDYISESELTELLNVDSKRIRDLRSHHITGKRQFIDHIKPTSRCVLYPLEKVLHYLENCQICSFGSTNGHDEDE